MVIAASLAESGRRPWSTTRASDGAAAVAGPVPGQHAPGPCCRHRRRRLARRYRLAAPTGSGIPLTVMAGRVPAICAPAVAAWMAGTGPAMTARAGGGTSPGRVSNGPRRSSAAAKAAATGSVIGSLPAGGPLRGGGHPFADVRAQGREIGPQTAQRVARCLLLIDCRRANWPGRTAHPGHVCLCASGYRHRRRRSRPAAYCLCPDKDWASRSCAS